MKKYKILKETPELEAGQVSFRYDSGSYHWLSPINSSKSCYRSRFVSYPIAFVQNNPEWFEEVEEEKTLEELIYNFILKETDISKITPEDKETDKMWLCRIKKIICKGISNIARKRALEVFDKNVEIRKFSEGWISEHGIKCVREALENM